MSSLQSTSAEMPSLETPLSKGRVLVVDEDVSYGRLLVKALAHAGFEADHIASFRDLGGFHRLHEYDSAILDFFQGAQGDGEMAEFLDVLGRYGVDVVVTSALDIRDLRARCDGRSWPVNVHRFVCKSYGLEYTIDTLYDLVRTRRALSESAGEGPLL